MAKREVATVEMNGKIVTELHKSESNPRNSEGAFFEMDDGRLMFAYSKYIGDAGSPESGSDSAHAAIAACYSADQGETWSNDVVIATPEEHQVINIMSVSFLRMQNGDIGLFYVIKSDKNNTRLHLRRSTNEGKTWGEAKCCIPGLGYYVTNNDRVIRLRNGRLVVPTAFHRMKDEDTSLQAHGDRRILFDGRGIACFFLSDDDGETWREAQNFCTLPIANTKSGLQEPGVIELKNGCLWAWARTDTGRQYEMISIDEGESWTPAVPSQFSSPLSPMSMKRIPSSGNLLAIWNPIPNDGTRYGLPSKRTPLVGAISRDEGRTWGDHFFIETAEKGKYQYAAIHFTPDRSILLGYGAREDVSASDACLRIRKIPLPDQW